MRNVYTISSCSPFSSHPSIIAVNSVSPNMFLDSQNVKSSAGVGSCTVNPYSEITPLPIPSMSVVHPSCLVNLVILLSDELYDGITAIGIRR